MKRFRIPLASMVSLAIALFAVAWSTLPAAGAELADELKKSPFKIIFETYQEKNWELFQVDADGSNRGNLASDPKLDELYPHVTPDGSKICFSCDEGEGDAKVRNVYVMNTDGGGRQRVAVNGRDPCWEATGTAVVYLPSEFDKYTPRDYASKGIAVFDLDSRTRRDHPNSEILHLYNICCTPDGKWYIATVHAGMGYGHAILAIEAQGKGVFDLKILAAGPDISHDGKRLAWGADDFTLCVADLDFSGPQPKVVNRRDVVKSEKPLEAYHVDWSPDGKYVAFSRGPKHKRLGFPPEMIGVQAEGWNIWVADADATNRWVQITTDGRSSKEPEWFLPKKADSK